VARRHATVVPLLIPIALAGSKLVRDISAGAVKG
jgi:hypothetical protein